MIFLTVGTHEPFDRLVRAVDDWSLNRDGDQEIIGQITARADYRPKSFEVHGNMSPSEFDLQFERASLVVSHAGMGTILTALSRSKPIVVMPRRGHLGETRNDHQYATIEHLPRRDGLWIARDEIELPSVLEMALRTGDAVGPRLEPFASRELIEALQNFIFGEKKNDKDR